MPFSSRCGSLDSTSAHDRSIRPARAGQAGETTRRARLRAAALLGAGLLLAAAGCGGGPAGTAGTGAAGTSGKPGILAAFYPLEWMTAKVAGPDAQVTTLTQPGVEPHDLELDPRQIASVEQAGLVVYIKGVQPAVDEAVGEQAPDKAFDVATAISTLPSTGDEEGHAEEEGHEEPSYDPHVWLDPTRLATAVTKLGDRLAAADPAHAAGYAARAKSTVAELTALDGELRAGLATCKSRTLVTSHSAFGYLADRYGLKQVGISGLDPEAEPSPARLAEVARVAKQEGVTTIFTEELVSPKVAEVLAKEVGATTAVLNPIESRPKSGDYLSAARANLTVLRSALGCS
ncbi:metal ABC transporter substrate-binding protein [Sphaerisporangium sp. B11E5]|uniref:metal ABC transporter substrate-binding protein n=1 Tax=Sphaerisporangium sp. B11E5 TaxID=3153563 RepID=UPI00325CED57